jgi:hypothetical protein
MFARMFARLKATLDPYFWLTLLLSLPVVGPFLQPGYHWGAHDARHAVYFLFQFDKAIRDGVWYPRWAPDFAFGQGYPFFNIYGPLSSYSGQIFLFLGFDYVTAVKIVFGLSTILSGLTMYFFVRHLLGPAAGLIAGLSYVYIPYHLLDLYVRAALAESVAFVFVPLVLWAFYRVTSQPSLRNVIWGAFAYAGLVFTSNLVTFLFTPFLAVYVLIMLLVKGINFDIIRRGIPAAAVVGLGLSLSSIFFLPLVFERQYIDVSQWTNGGGRFVYQSFFVDLYQLFSPHWGFGIAVPGPDDDLSYQLGLAAVILFALSFWAVPRLENQAVRLTLRFMQGLVVVITLLMLSISLPAWEILPLADLAQFPWRLLVITAPGLAVLAGSVAASVGQQEKRQVLYNIIPLSLLIILASYPYLQAQLRDPYPTEGPVNLANLFRFQQSANELTGVTSWVKEIPTWSALAEVVIQGGDINTRVLQSEVNLGDAPLMGVHSFEIDSVHEFVWVFAADDQQAVTFYIPYHPGWTATLYEDTAPEDPDLFPYGRIGRPISYPTIRTTDPEGWMVVPVPEGSHFLELRFKDTPIRIVGKWVSLLTLIFMAAALVFEKQLTNLVTRSKYAETD